jgi:hypothetical protein
MKTTSVLRTLTKASVYVPLLIAMVTLIQFATGTWLLEHRTACILVGTICFCGIICDIIGVFGAKANGWIVTLVLALCGFALNAFGIVLSVILYAPKT